MCHRLWHGDCTCKQVVNRLKIPQGLSTLYCFTGGVKFPQGEESAVIHHKKNYLLYKDATCDFIDVTAFSSVFFLALHYCFFLFIFFLLKFYGFFFGFLIFLPISFSWLCCSFSRAPSPLSAAFSGCFFGLFCPVLLGG